MKNQHKCLTVMLMIVVGLPVLAEDIHLELLMPGDMFGPESLFSLDLAVENTGGPFADAELFVALSVGTGDFWFYPSWAQYPPEIDWETVFVPGYSSDQWVIFPEFLWPHGAGSFDGAMFLAAILHNGELVSNLAECMFGWSEAPQPTPTPTSTPPETTPTPTTTPVRIEVVYIHPGAYLRGSPDDELCRWQEEGPQHQVTLTQGFYMMTTEVTRQMWADLKEDQPTLPNDPSRISISPTMDHPVQQVQWNETVLFANLLSFQNGLTPAYFKDEAFTIPVNATNYLQDTIYCNFNANGYRLPTEAEWEYAARAGTTGPFSSHEPNYSEDTCETCDPDVPLNVLDEIAWWCGNSGDDWTRTSHPVGAKLPNHWGLYDMHGNVWEWCWDWFGLYSSEPLTDPTGAVSDTYRMVRGGGWNAHALHCRSAFRSVILPNNRLASLGFRLVRTAD